MVDFVVDSFSGEATNIILTQHTGEVGATWSLLPGATASSYVSSSLGSAYCETTGTQGNFASGSPASADYIVEADIKYITGVDGGYVGIVGRADTSNITFYHVRYHDVLREFQLYKSINNIFTLLGTYAQILTAGTEYNLKLGLNGSTITVRIDDVLRIPATDSTITAAGKAGIRFNITSSTNKYHPRLDNYKATDISSTLSPISGSFGAVAKIQGSASKKILLSGMMDCLAGPSGAIGVKKHLSGSMAALAGASGTACVKKSLSGVMTCDASVSVSATVIRRMAGRIESVAGIEGLVIISEPNRIRLSGSMSAMAAMESAQIGRAHV